jgi:GTPase
VENSHSRCGYIAIVGRPNVGKSTLLNAILNRKLAITSHKAQTTRHAILGIKTVDTDQFIYVDTPGMHRSGGRQLNRVMNRTAEAVLYDVDIVLFLVEARKWQDADEQVLNKLKKIDVPVLLVLNKVDQLKNKEKLLPLLASLNNKFEFTDVVPISAMQQKTVSHLEEVVEKYLPSNPHFFPDGQLTDRGGDFIIAEMLREKILQYCQEEVPYSATVTVEKFERNEKILNINVVIWVERETQKAIVIGKKGENLKNIASRARHDLEKHFNEKIFLQCYVKVKSGWADSHQALQKFGLLDNLEG